MYFTKEMSKMNKIIFGIVGPTASGKTRIALELAKKFPIEIISCDSMQIYKGMDIGTAKPSKGILDSVTHHMINIIEPEEEFSAAEYSDIVRKITFSIIKENKIPFIVGGSGLYYNTYIDGIFPEVKKDKNFRKKLREFAKEKGNERLHQKLEKIDPDTAKKLHFNDLRRVIRALEVYHITGKTITEKKEQKTSIQKSGYEPYIFGIKLPREVLYNSINNRVDALIENGLVEEAKNLKEKNLSITSKMAIGYKEIYSYLNGNESLEKAIENIKQYTRNYARRQMTWFKKRKEIEWIELGSSEEWKKAVNDISNKVESNVSGY